MLERIRDGIQGPWAIAIVALIVVSFVFTGVGGYLTSSATNASAIVNDTEIPASALENAYQNERARMESQFGDAIANLFANESYLLDFRRGVLDRLINEELIAQKAKDLGLRVSDAEIKRAIVDLPEFQIVGQFSNESYNAALQRAGFTPTQFAEYMRTQMTRQQLIGALNGSSFDVEALVGQTLSIRQQTRDASLLEVNAASYVEDVTVTEDEILSFYNSNLSQYDTQEQVKLAYVSLSIADLVEQVDVTDEDVRNEYDEQIAFYQTPEQRSVSHILFEIQDDADAAEAEAQDVLMALQSGADFALTAEQTSDDIVSAESGGSLGSVSVGDYPLEFEEAVFALNEVGEISTVVQTEFGFHIIKLDNLTPSTTTPFAEVADNIKDELVANRATDLFFDLQTQMQRLAFEVPDTLDEVSVVAGRPIFETVLFSAERYPSAVNYPQVENVAFSAELIEDGVNSELLQISDDKVMVVRMVEHNPQRTKSLDEVRAGIMTDLLAQKAQLAAMQWAQDLQSAMFAGEDVQVMLDKKSLNWNNISTLSRTSSGVSPQLVDAAFELSTAANNNSTVVTLNNGNVGVVILNGVNPVSAPTEQDIESARQQLTGQNAQRTYQNFVEALRSNADIQIVR